MRRNTDASMPLFFEEIINGAQDSIVRKRIGAEYKEEILFEEVCEGEYEPNSSTRCFNRLQRNSSDSGELKMKGC